MGAMLILDATPMRLWIVEKGKNVGGGVASVLIFGRGEDRPLDLDERVGLLLISKL